MTQLIDGLLAPLARPEVALACVAFILSSLAVACFRFRLHDIGAPRAELQKLLHGLQKIPDQAGFVSAFPTVDQGFRKARKAQDAWREFDETLLKPTDAMGGVIRATVRPNHYFNRESFGLTFPFWHALPNYFVGIGLLLTFLGLVAALRSASDAVGADVLAATAALKTLLAAATFKFGSSIAGLLSSIVFSFFYHKWVKQLDDSFEAVCRELERLTVFITSEGLAQEQLLQLEVQTTQLKLFNTEIGMQIADRLGSRLDASLAESLRAAIEPLGSAVDRLAKGLAEQNVDALRAMAEDFRQGLAAGAGEEFRNVAGTLKALQGSLGETGTRLGERLGEAGDRAAARLDAAADALANALQPFSERLIEAERGLGELAKELGDLTGAFKGTSANAESAAGALTNAAERLEAAAKPIALTAARFSATLEGMAAARTGLTSLAEQIGALSAALARSWQNYAVRFDEVDGRLERMFGEFRSGTASYHEVVRDFVRELDGSLSKATASLAGGVADLRGAIEELGEVAARPNGHDPRPEPPT